MHIVAIGIGVIWVAFWIYWFAAAAGVKPGQSRFGRSMGIRFVFLILAVILARTRVIKGRMIRTDPLLEGIGVVLLLAGLGLALWARRFIGRNWGTPMSQKDDPELVTTGPYRWVRHPIYSGLILAGLGSAFAISWYLVFIVLGVGAYFVYSAVMEERYMTTRFPEAYPEYRRSSKMLIPFVF